MERLILRWKLDSIGESTNSLESYRQCGPSSKRSIIASPRLGILSKAIRERVRLADQLAGLVEVVPRQRVAGLPEGTEVAEVGLA